MNGPRMADHGQRGLMVVSARDGAARPPAAGWAGRMGLRDDDVRRPGPEITTWGLDPTLQSDATLFLLSRAPRAGDRDMTTADVGDVVRAAPQDRGPVLPPFGALLAEGHRHRFAVDGMGFRQLYVRQGTGWAAVSTSARALNHLEPGSLDLTALATQSLLGWQVGARTWFEGTALAAPSVTLQDGDIQSRSASRGGAERPPAEPVRVAARLLRDIVTAYLDDHPDAELQLTGGLDSRILLAAVPPARRRDLRVMTLSVPGSSDVAIAAALARRYGMPHHIKDFGALSELLPAEAFALAVGAARRLDLAADPIAQAAVDCAEGIIGDRPRIVGLGGEIARGFYYAGPAQLQRISRRRVERLARWRLFTNEAVPPEMFTHDFARWARAEASRAVWQAFQEGGGASWFDATDRFYSGQRMRRWAGALASAACLERVAVNPMLDPRFQALVESLPPEQKRGARFLAQLLHELDPELAAIPMDGRPAPSAYARSSPGNVYLQMRAKWPKLVRKVRQRATGMRLPPEGGAILADRVLDHMRSHRAEMEALTRHGILDEDWIDRLVGGEVRPSVAGCSFLVNLLAI